jgi:hypothetical protein
MKAKYFSEGHSAQAFLGNVTGYKREEWLMMMMMRSSVLQR